MSCTEHIELEKEGYVISSDKKKLDHAMIHRFLTVSYWAEGRTLAEVSTSIENAICFGVYREETQVGFARVITDHVTLAYLADVFILPAHQSKGLGKWLVHSILNVPLFKKNIFWLLLTQDAQWLYQQFGFRRFHCPEGVMTKYDPNNK